VARIQIMDERWGGVRGKSRGRNDAKSHVEHDKSLILHDARKRRAEITVKLSEPVGPPESRPRNHHQADTAPAQPFHFLDRGDVVLWWSHGETIALEKSDELSGRKFVSTPAVGIDQKRGFSSAHKFARSLGT